MMSRLRSASKYPSRLVISCNPDPDHKIKELIQWYLDDEGYPIAERDGVIRYFVRRDGEFYWADSEQELKNRFGDDVLPLSFTFISATIHDNPIMQETNPSYKNFLEGLNPTDKARLLFGNWEARPEGANYFKRDWLKNADRIPLNARCCRSWDKAGTERTTENKHPDFTACVKMYKTYEGDYYLVGDYHEDIYDDVTETYGRFCKQVGARDKLIVKQGLQDGDDCPIILPVDPGSHGKAEYQQSAKYLLEHGLLAKSDPIPTNKSKLIKFTPFASAAENGLVYIVRSSFDDKTYQALMKEMETFDGQRSKSHIGKNDDYVDCVASAFNYLAQSKVIKPFAIPEINAPTGLADIRS